jgi:hypothetical protein
MIRKQLLLSTATVCLMLASGLVYAQSPADSKKDDTQKERVQKSEPSKSEPAKDAEPRSDAKGHDRASERTGAKDQKTPAASMEKSGASKQDQKDRAGSEGAKQRDQAGDSKRGNKDAASEKSAQDSQKSKSGESKSGESKSGAASSDRPQNQNQAGESSKTGPAQSQQTSTPPSAQTNKPAAANEADRNRTTNEAQRGQANGPQGGSSSSTVSTGQTQISGDKQVRISETLTRTQLAPPERNLNVSISVGVELPRGVRTHRLPPDIVSIEPEYRDYEYVSTDDQIVIIEPRSHRIVSTIPRDPARARAQMQGGSNTADMRGGAATTNVAGNTTSPCRIMRRDASGQLSEASPTTVGSSAQRPNWLAVIVQTPDQRSTPPIPLDAQAGQIVVATQGQGDCTVTIEPQGAR